MTPAEVIVMEQEHGLPYSKGVMAQSLTATGVTPPHAFELARTIEARLEARGLPQIDREELYDIVEEVLGEADGDDARGRFSDWRALERLDRPLIVMLGGTTGVGKSTLATMLASRMGINRMIATDVIRQVLRAFFSHEFMPAVHYSAYDAGKAVDQGPGGDTDLVGFLSQARSVGTGVQAIVQRAARERTPMIVEGVHLIPGMIEPELRNRIVLIEAVLTVEDEELHRGHFSMRGPLRPAERYLGRFEQIRKLQSYLSGKGAEAGVAVIDNEHLDAALSDVMGLVLKAAGRASQGGETA
ncbi:MAG TPA: hypothetical protein VNT32_02215 [Thermoleophilaceae bacterium]|nr:hypothetical protein [Thermoleophilaceae bacterium]